jgi:hypothetical protein
MSLKKISLVFLLALSLFPVQKLFAQVENAGIIPANIWYSKDPFEAGDKIKIFTVVYNRDARELSGTVIFFDHDVFLGKNNFTVPAKSVRDVSIDWTATAGDHVIFAKIENAKFLISAGKYEEVYVVENKTEDSKRTVSVKIDPKSPIDSTVTASGVKKIVAENTPAFITRAIDSTVNTLESIREKANTYATDEKIVLKKEIAVIDQKELESATLPEGTIEKAADKGSSSVLLDKSKTTPEKATLGPKVERPLKYLGIFLLNVGSFIFGNKIVFYLLLVVIVFFIFRFFWRLVF